MEEIWKDVIGYEGYYQISNNGKVKKLAQEKRNGQGYKSCNETIKATVINYKGYEKVQLYKEGKIKTLSVHRLVAIAFISNPLELPQVNHKDAVKLNNNVWNLEWCTNQQNKDHAVANNLLKPPQGANHYNARLSETDVLKIRELHGTMTQVSIGKLFNIDAKHVNLIVLRKKWKHI